MRLASLLLLLLAGCWEAHVPSLKYEDVGVAGLWTNPNPELKRPPGALSRADEVVFRRPGMVEPRPGFNRDDSGSLDAIKGLISYGDGMLTVGPSGSDTATEWQGGDPVFADDADTLLAWDSPDNVRGVEVRGNLYLTTQGNLRKLSADDDEVAPITGLIPPNLFGAIAVVGTGVAVLDGMTVAYQAVLERTDANGVIVQSAPSGRLLFTNDTGADVNVTVGWTARDGLTGDILRIFRTEGVATGAPDNDLSFVVGVTLDSDAPSVEAVDDITADANRGALLYTSDSATNGGIARGNARPPVSRELALYKQSLFFVGITTPAIKVVRYTEGEDDVLLVGGADRVGSHSRTVTRTHNSAILSGISTTTAALRVGMILSDATGWAGTGTVSVVSVDSPSQVTMSEQYTGGTGGATISFLDVIQVGGTYYPAHLLWVLIQAVNGGYDPTRNVASAVAYARGLGDDAQYVPSAGYVKATRAVAFEALNADDSYAIRATHGELYDPPLPEITDSAETVAPTEVPNGYAWSKADEPEHALLLIRRVGNNTKTLRALTARDALWQLKGKGDGIYRTSGFGELTGWRDDLFDASTYLLHPRLATVLDDKIYAWTNKGAVEITDAGVRVISTPIADQTADMERIINHADSAGAACFAVADPSSHEVIFGIPGSLTLTPGTFADKVLVYNTLTGAWATWFTASTGTTWRLTSAALDAERGLLAFGDRSGKLFTALGPVTAAGIPSVVRTADLRTELTLDAVTADDWIAYTSTVTVVVGDRLVQGVETGRVLQLRTVLGVTEMLVEGDPDRFTTTTTAASLYKAVLARMTWLPRKPGISMVKRFDSFVVHWDDTRGVAEWTFQLEGARNPGVLSDQLTYTFDYQATTQLRADTRVLVPLEYVLDTQLYPTVRVQQTDSRWRITGLTTGFQPASDRVYR